MKETTKYLYGASVQGIQGFIFQSNELKSIVGASELVERICTQLFTKEFKGCTGQMVISAAGNVKCIFTDKDECRTAVRLFPKRVMEAAPGITISQAVVKYEDAPEAFGNAVEELDRRLHAQRNRPMKSLTCGAMAIERSSKTGLPAVERIKSKDNKDELLDEATVAKRKCSQADDPQNPTMKLARKSFGNDYIHYNSLPFDLKDLTKHNEWIAIIHADGNGLGAVVARMNKKEDELREFSENLDKATCTAAQRAFRTVVKAENYEPTGEKIPFRPVVLGGDDMTMICRADLAMAYTQKYLEFFEEETNKMGHALTACAGIAYMKSAYPFFYGYDLAEALCDAAKKDAKRKEHLRDDGLASSCLMFHKIQSSFVTSYQQMVDNELTLREGGSFQFGPYYLTSMDERWTIKDLTDAVGELSKEEKNAVKTDLRQWLTLMTKSREEAKQKEKRVKTISSKGDKELFCKGVEPIKREGKDTYPAYDMLSLLTVENQTTKA